MVINNPKQHDFFARRSSMRQNLYAFCGEEVTRLFDIKAGVVICPCGKNINIWTGKLQNITPIITHATGCHILHGLVPSISSSVLAKMKVVAEQNREKWCIKKKKRIEKRENEQKTKVDEGAGKIRSLFSFWAKIF